ncbi:MAG: polysaccharide biosynthesis tyrosine autokinase [Nitrospinae bacterium]|nr:polysaccharide biosynthesis tyrosine autokinase [Nitrospinota bacterium]
MKNQYNRRDTDRRDAHLKDYIGLILKRKWIVITTFLTLLTSAVVFSSLVTPTYEASTTVRVEEKKGEIIGISEPLLIPKGLSPIETEMEIIKSRTLAEKVVRDLQIDKEIVKSLKGVKFSISPIEVYDLVEPGRYTIKFTDSNRSFVLLYSRNDILSYLYEGTRGILGDNISFYLHDSIIGSRLYKGIQKILGDKGSSNKVDKIIGYGIVDKRFSGGGISFTLTGVKAKPNDKIVLKIYDFNERVQGLQDSIDVESVRRADIIKISLQDKDPHRVASILNSLTTNYLEQNLDIIRKEASKAKEFIIGQIRDIREEIEARESALNVLQLEYNKYEMLKEFTADHPNIIFIQKKVDETRNELGMMAKDIPIPMTLSEASQLLEKTKRELKVKEDIYNLLLEKEQEARLTEASEVGNIRVIDPAIIPDKPIRPRKMVNTLLGGIVGVIFGVGFAFLSEYMDKSIRSKEDIEKIIKLPVFGAIPYVKDINNEKRYFIKRTLGEIAEKGLFEERLIVSKDPRSYTAEAYRTLRTNIQFTGMERETRVILFTSAVPSEGKSTVLSNLAVITANMGAKTLVVDTDLRKPILHKVFGRSREPGLTNIMSSGLNWETIVYDTHFENLSLICAGTKPPNPSELLGSNKMVVLLKEWRENYDIVLLDSPPVIPVTDAAILGAIVDGIFLVIRAGTSVTDVVLHAKELLEKVHARIIGAISNNAIPEKGYYGEKYYRYYQSYEEDYDILIKKKKTRWDI